jgi:hypothetical protein
MGAAREEEGNNHIIPMDLCVQLDNVESAKVQFDVMATELETILDTAAQGSTALAKETLKDTFDVCLRDTLRFVREELTRLQGLIAKKVCIFLAILSNLNRLTFSYKRNC